MLSHDTVALLVMLGTGFGSLLLYFRRMEKKFDFILIEHETLMLDYANRIGRALVDLPTRTGGVKP